MFRIKKISLLLLPFSLLGFVPLATVEADLITNARIRVKVIDRPGGYGILGAEVDITDAPSGVACENCPGETDENGEVTLTLTGVPSDPSEITVAAYVSGFKEKTVKTVVIAFAMVDLEIIMTPEFLLQVTKSGTGGGTVTSSPSGIYCGVYCEEDYIEDTVVSLTAEAYSHSNFTGWSGGGCSGTGNCTVTMNQTHTVNATFTLAECGGNFDHDGDVDGSDLAVFAADFGRTDCDSGPECEGDFDGDFDVDGSDLAVFAADFGRTDCPTH